MPSQTPLYDQDFHAWTLETAKLLRKQSWNQVEWEAVVEEIESLGKSQERELASRIFQLTMHLLKWIAQPSRRQTSRSWTTSIRNQRRELGRLLRQSPSLRHQVEGVLVEEYATAVDEAMHQTGLPREAFPPLCPWTAPQVLENDFWPETFPEGL
jgi:uncharacterized protein DUF29